MLIRFVVKNLFSFKDETEFNLLPGRIKRLEHHKYYDGGVEALKLSALYGANGSGKSNLVYSLSLLQKFIVSNSLPFQFTTQKFKLSELSEKEPVDLSIEFTKNDTVYYYSISINHGKVIEEYLAEVIRNENKLIFQRLYVDEITKVQFFKDFDSSLEGATLKKLIETDLLKTNQTLLALLHTISNDSFISAKNAYSWIVNDLNIVYPESKPTGLVQEIDSKPGFKKLANQMMCAFNTGITNLNIEEKKIEEFLGEDQQNEIEEIKSKMDSYGDNGIYFLTNKDTQEEIAVIKNDTGSIMTKRLLFEHKGDKDQRVKFRYDEESDGTRRLLEYLPAINSLIDEQETFVIDEIERSIHPLIIKEIVSKFSQDALTKGQLIFTTHESNLLDQNIFRTDEIWFADKNLTGASKLYSLYDFKEHSTIDIRKGYLNGRYGAIPFLGNLRDLNWEDSEYAASK